MTPAITDNHMAVLLEAARDFAFGEMAREGRLVPFAAYITPPGPIDCMRLEDGATTEDFGAIYNRTIAAMCQNAASGEILACALVAAIAGGEDVMGRGFTEALSIHLESPQHCREVLVPYRIEKGDVEGEARLVLGQMAPHPSARLVYTRPVAA